MKPYEILNGPIEVWYAPVAEAFPDLDDAAPAGNWAKLGTSGSKVSSRPAATNASFNEPRKRVVLGSPVVSVPATAACSFDISFSKVTLFQFQGFDFEGLG